MRLLLNLSRDCGQLPNQQAFRSSLVVAVLFVLTLLLFRWLASNQIAQSDQRMVQVLCASRVRDNLRSNKRPIAISKVERKRPKA